MGLDFGNVNFSVFQDMAIDMSEAAVHRAMTNSIMEQEEEKKWHCWQSQNSIWVIPFDEFPLKESTDMVRMGDKMSQFQAIKIWL